MIDLRDLFHRIITKLKSYVAILYRSKVVEQMRQRNELKNCTIISSNCIGGILSHDLGLRFDSPTVNLFFEAEGFVKFVEHLEYFLSLELADVSMDSERKYPVGRLEDIELHFVHYKTPEEAIEKWETRKKRVNYDKLFLICTDRNGMTEELLKRYLSVPYKKVIYVANKEKCLTEECIYVPGFENENEVGEMDKYADWKGHRRYEQPIDLVSWLNERN